MVLIARVATSLGMPVVFLNMASMALSEKGDLWQPFM